MYVVIVNKNATSPCNQEHISKVFAWKENNISDYLDTVAALLMIKKNGFRLDKTWNSNKDLLSLRGLNYVNYSAYLELRTIFFFT